MFFPKGGLEAASPRIRAGCGGALEEIGEMHEVLHGGDGARRDVAEEPGERLDGGLRNRVPRDELHIGAVLVAGAPLSSEQIVHGLLVRIIHACTDSGLGKRGSEEIFPITVMRA